VEDKIFLGHAVAIFMDDALMTVYKLVVDNKNSYTMQQLKNKIAPKDRRKVGFIKDEYKDSFAERIDELDFNNETIQLRKMVKDLRNDRVGHSTRDWVLGKSAVPLLGLNEFRDLISATRRMYSALCFNTHRTLLPISYDPAVTHPNYGDNRPDIEKILDFLARESLVLNMPEHDIPPGAWAEQRKRLTPKELEQINYYRKKFNLPEA